MAAADILFEGALTSSRTVCAAAGDADSSACADGSLPTSAVAFADVGGAAVAEVRRSGPRPAVDAGAGRAPVTEDGILFCSRESIAKGDAIRDLPVAAMDARAGFSDHGRAAYGAGVAASPSYLRAFTRWG